MIALAAVAAACLIGGPIVDQIADALPKGAAPRLAAPVFIGASIVDIGCIVVAHNPNNALEAASHLFAAGIALHALGVRGEAAVRNTVRGSDPWMRQ